MLREDGEERRVRIIRDFVAFKLRVTNYQRLKRTKSGFDIFSCPFGIDGEANAGKLAKDRQRDGFCFSPLDFSKSRRFECAHEIWPNS
jgi:hypothetical protein